MFAEFIEKFNIMPKKRKGLSLTRSTASSKRTREARDSETPEQSQRRRSSDADAHTAARQVETRQQAEQRRAADAAAHAAARRAETQQQAEQHRAANAASHAAARRAETRQQAQQRCANDAAAHATAREAENQAQSQQRRAADAAAHVAAREAENEAQSQQRQQADAAAHAAARVVAREHRVHETVQQRRQRLAQARRRPRPHYLGRENVTPQPHSVGRCDIECLHCHAYRFPGETLNCCSNGKVELPLFQNFPQDLKDLFVNRDELANNFKTNIRHFNSAMAFASIGAQLVTPPGIGPYCYRIHGQLYHSTGTLHPPQDGNGKRQYGQLYILEGDQAVTERLARRENVDCSPAVMNILQNVMHTCNPYAAAFANMNQVEQFETENAHAMFAPVPKVTMVFKTGRDDRRYNSPVHDEVAAVFVGQQGAPPTHQDIVIYPRGEPLRRISFMNPNLDPMCYPLFFPRGELGWSDDLQHVPERRTRVRTKVTQLEFYSYVLAQRPTFSPIHNGGKLLQQYTVDSYCKIEAARLLYHTLNQGKLRVESYQGLMDYVQNRAAERNLPPGKVVILPSTFNGSPRNMQQNFQDAMALVSNFGRPCLFITFTANPKSQNVLDALRPGQTAPDRPDLVCRIFRLQLDQFITDLTKKHVLGLCIACVYVIEFQKRGLPHSHILLWLDEESHPRDSEQVDSLIRAEIPDSHAEQTLHDLVKAHMMHGPCGDDKPNNVCMREGKCSKDFPKLFQDETVITETSFPKYQRRNNGRKVFVRGCHLDNRYVVPYSPYLLQKYRSHINVELCTGVKSVKYIFKYVFKGHDCASLEATLDTAEGENPIEHNEIKSYVESRYVSAPEAMWRISKYPMHHFTHTVTRLGIHLPLQNNIYLQEGNIDADLHRAANTDTTLTAWFKLNDIDDQAHDILYCSIPQHYVWNKSEKKWKRRQRRGDNVLSRMYHVSPRDVERFHLRLLLLHVPGATSYEFLRTVDGQTLDSFKEACVARNLLQDDNEWHSSLSEASLLHMPSQIRQLFVTILVFCNPKSGLELWQAHSDALCEDFLQHMNLYDAKQSALIAIHHDLRRLGSSGADHDLPQPDNWIVPNEQNNEPPPVPNLTLDDLNPEQRAAADAIIQELERGEREGEARIFYIDGPGGTGKTALLNFIIYFAISRGFTVASSAWTGCAKELLHNGRTIHNLFKLPVPILETSSCNIRPDSPHAHYLRSLDLNIMDEASMIDVYASDAIDRMLRDITRRPQVPFGGKLIVFGGDFRQVLPVVPHAGPAEILEHCIKRSPLWQHVRLYPLTTNMRALQDERNFAEWLLQVGNGSLRSTVDDDENTIDIPEQSVCNGDIIDEIFPDLNDPHVYDSVILTPKNEATHPINEAIVQRLDGDQVKYISTDQAVCETEEEAYNYPIEFLHSITPSGMPPHILKLKPAASLIMLRSLDNSKGLCNGTRLKILQLHPNLIHAQVLSGSKIGTTLFIPRIKLAPSDPNLPFILSRRQFPVRLAFALTINKAQGATFSKVGLYLPEPVFSHGQLYVAASRTRSFSALKVKVLPTTKQGVVNGKTTTQNVVWQAALQ